MCLTTNDATIKIAEQDITVYKRLQFPPKAGFFRKLFKPSITWPYSTRFGNFPYKPGLSQPIVNLVPTMIRQDKHIVNEGYHSHANKQPRVNAELIIPKGAKYIEGWNNDIEDVKDYVSETIIFVKEI